MILCKPIGQRLTVLFLSLFVISIVNISAQDAAAGKAIFTGKCAACHNVFKKMTGPALMGLEERGKWADHKELLAWINNPAAYMAKDPYTQGLKAEYGPMMTGFADVTLKDVDDMVAYINAEVANKNAAPKPGAVTETADTGNQNAIIFGVISLVLGIIALILMQVNSNLKKMSDDSEGIVRPEPVAFYRNKTYIAMASIVFFVFGGYMVAKGA
ncbi:MAG: cytochrome c, partial [Chitinophagaceae bacterium]|nr:cytochrome c [Chitinophagaceae bacterium]